MGSDHELNAKAARICGYTVDPMQRAGNAVLATDEPRWRSFWFDPCTNPADCAMLKRAIREKGYFIRLAFEGHWHAASFACPNGTDGPTIRHQSEERAVTAAAVAAIEVSKV